MSAPPVSTSITFPPDRLAYFLTHRLVTVSEELVVVAVAVGQENASFTFVKQNDDLTPQILSLRCPERSQVRLGQLNLFQTVSGPHSFCERDCSIALARRTLRTRVFSLRIQLHLSPHFSRV